MKTIFVKVRNDQGAAYEYDPVHHGGSASYTDFWRLVELSDFETCEIGEIDFDSEDAYIFAPNNGNIEAALKGREHKCRLIHWELERPGDELKPWFDEIWVSDKTQFNLIQSLNKRYLILGGHPLLGPKPEAPKLWDFCPMAYLYGAREAKVNNIAMMGFKIAPSTFDPAERNIALSKSSYGLMLHQSDYPILEPLRAVLFACSRMPIVCEYVADSYPYKFIPYEDDLKTLSAMSRSFVLDMMEDNYAMVAETHTFRRCVDETVHGDRLYQG